MIKMWKERRFSTGEKFFNLEKSFPQSCFHQSTGNRGKPADGLLTLRGIDITGDISNCDIGGGVF